MRCAAKGGAARLHGEPEFYCKLSHVEVVQKRKSAIIGPPVSWPRAFSICDRVHTLPWSISRARCVDRAQFC